MPNDPELIIIVDFKGIVKNNASTIQRHELYGSTLSSITNGNTRLLILGNVPHKFDLGEFTNLEFTFLPKSSKFMPIFIAMSVRALWHKRQRIKMIVAGDPWTTLLVAKIIRYILNTKIGLQVQLHGDFFSSAWQGLRLQNRIAGHFLPLLLRNCESIRVVNSSQVQDLIDYCNIETNRIVCVPLPLNVPRIPANNLRHEGLPLAFVGRLEEERGLSNLLQIVKLIPEVFVARTLWISGAGKKRVSLERELEMLLPHEAFVFTGELDARELMEMWTRVGILFSLAPAETYGLAMREAIVNGVPVLAVSSAGSMALKQFLNGDELIIIDEPFEGAKITEQLSILDKVQIAESTRNALYSESAKFVEILCTSWLRTTEK